MSGEVWSFIETEGGGLSKTATRIATEATRVGNMLGEIPCGMVFANDAGALTEELSQFGLQKLYSLTAEAPGMLTPEACAHAVGALVSKHKPHLVLFAATPYGSEIAARVAARLGSAYIANCIDFARGGEGFVARKAVYDRRAHLTLTWSGPPPHIASVDPEALEAIEERSQVPVEVIEEAAQVGALDTELLSRWKTDPQQLDLVEASLVVGVGRPIISRIEELPKLRDSAEKIGAVFGCSRPVVDAGALPKERQIGASGKWITADVYIACAVSGSTYHMMGVRGVRHLVAVNIDRNAPILKQAELGIVGDMFEILPALAKLSETDK
jgi:electron transfer flavoprotein alpha subunit